MFLGFGFCPANPYTTEKLCSRRFYFYPQKQKTASWGVLMKLQSLHIGESKIFGVMHCNDKPSSIAMVKSGSLSSTKLLKPAPPPPSSTAMKNGGCNSTGTHFLSNSFCKSIETDHIMPKQMAFFPLWILTNKYLVWKNASLFRSNFGWNSLWAHCGWFQDQTNFTWFL